MNIEVIQIDDDCIVEEEEIIDDSNSDFQDLGGSSDDGEGDDESSHWVQSNPKSSDETSNEEESSPKPTHAKTGEEGVGSARGACGSPTSSQTSGRRSKRVHEHRVWRHFRPLAVDASYAGCLLCNKKIFETDGEKNNQRSRLGSAQLAVAITEGLMESKRTAQSSLDGHLVAPGCPKQAMKWVSMACRVSKTYTMT